jgi:hypothetical protein
MSEVEGVDTVHLHFGDKKRLRALCFLVWMAKKKSFHTFQTFQSLLTGV